MSAIDWQEDFDDDDNSIWCGCSPYTTDADGPPNVYWRLKQRLRDNKIEWYEAHDSELLPDPRFPECWPDIEAAKAAVQLAHDGILADFCNAN